MPTHAQQQPSIWESVRRARAAYARDQWIDLINAHTALIQGRIQVALSGFRRVLKGIPDLMGNSPYAWPVVSDAPDQPSAASALIYLAEFFQLTKTWQTYTVLAQPIRDTPEYRMARPVVRAHVEAAWWIAQAGTLPYDDVLAGLDAALALVQDDPSEDGRWAKTAVHLAAAEANSREFRIQASLDHANAALDYGGTLSSPYFIIRAYEEIGNAYYYGATVNDDPALYAACEEAHDLGDAVMYKIGEDAFPMSRDYDRGWLYSRLHRYDDAVHEFRRGAKRREKGDLMYDAGRCYYGMGYALSMCNRVDEARGALRIALDIFNNDGNEQLHQDALGARTRSAQMMALILQVLGITYMVEGKYREALAHLEQSREHLLSVTNPGPWYDTLFHLVNTCSALKHQHRLAYYEHELAYWRAQLYKENPQG